MLYACQCLNCIIDASGNTKPVESFIVEMLSIRAQGLELRLVNLESVTKKIDLLVGYTRLTEWAEFHCLYCDVWIYAHCSSKSLSPESKVIINNKLLITPEELELFKADDDYSPVFKILRRRETGAGIFSGSRSDMSYNEPLHQVASLWLQEQTEMVKVRVRNFADQQYEELDKKRLLAFAEQSAIFRSAGISRPERTLTVARHVDSPVEHSKSTKTPASSYKDKMPKPVSEPPEDLREFEDLMLFEAPISGYRDSVVSEESDEDVSNLPSTCRLSGPESDEDAHDMLPSRRLSEPIMARSLPIPVPQFLEERRHDDRHEKSPQTPTDIAANIQALARSIHGSPIFGDLPRPRLTKD